MAGPCKVMVVVDEPSVAGITRMTLESGLSADDLLRLNRDYWE